MPAGYEATIQCGTGAAQAYTGGPFAVTSPATDGATITCTITNKQKTSTVRVVKAWVGAPSTTTIFVDQNGVGALRRLTVATATGDSASFTYPISTPVTVGETPVPAGYAATIRCGEGTAQPYTGAPFPVTSPAVGGSTITCTITNTQQLSSVRVVKEWVGAPSTTTIFVDATGAAPFDASTVATASGASASFTYPISTPVTVGEVAPVPAGYAATIQCGTGAPVAYTGGPFAVTSPAIDGATITCTIVNTQQLSKIRVIKNWSGTPTSATIFVDQNGVAPFDASTVATADGHNTFFTYPVSTPAFVGETAVPAGFTATIQCGAAAPQPYAGGAFAVTSPATNGDTLTCTISNNIIPPPATVRVVKEWIGAPSSATIFVDQDGVAPFDAETVATADGDNTSFDYTAGTAATVGETAVPTGYDATIQCGANRALPYQGGPFAVVAPAAGETLTCTITNRQLLSTVRVVKQWVGAPSSAEIFVDATGAAPYDASTTATASGDTTFFVYPVSTPVTAGETTVPVGYQATISCGELQGRQQYNGGPFPVTSPAQHLGVVTCTITNTQKLSFVRTVKQWVGATSSAEIFVDLNGTTPYDASTIATASGDNTSFVYPTSTPVTVGETTVPAGYEAEIACGHTQPRQPYNGGPFPVVSPAQHLGVLTCTVTNSQLFSTVQVVKQWIGTPASTTIFVDAGRRGTLRRLDRRHGERRQRLLHVPGLDPRHRRRDPRAGRLRRHHRLRAGPPALHRRPLPGHLSRRRGRGHHLHDHEHGAPLDRPGRQGLGRSALIGNALRRRERDGAVRRLHRRHRQRPEHFLHVSRLHPGGARRDGRAGRLHRDDRLRRRPAALHRRPVPGHLPGRRRRHTDLHDHEHASDDRARGQELGRPSEHGGRSSSTRPAGLRSTFPRSPSLTVRASRSTTSLRPESRSAKSRCPPDTVPSSTAAQARRICAATQVAHIRSRARRYPTAS